MQQLLVKCALYLSSRANFSHNLRDFRFISILSSSVSLIDNSAYLINKSLRASSDFLLLLGIHHHHLHHLSHLTTVILFCFYSGSLFYHVLILSFALDASVLTLVFEFLDALVIWLFNLSYIYVGFLINNYRVVFYLSMIGHNFDDKRGEEVTCILNFEF